MGLVVESPGNFSAGKSWNFLGHEVEADIMMQVQILWLPLDMQNRKDIQLQGALPPDPLPDSFRTNCLLFLSDSDQQILKYGFSYQVMYIYMVNNCCLSLYLNVAGI